MKKLIIAAACAAMVGGAFAACSDADIDLGWDLSFKLKTLAPKKMNCKTVCGDKSTVYYLDAGSVTLKGYLVACEYECDTTDVLGIILWDTTNKRSIVAPAAGALQEMDVDFTDDFMVYGKKATKVAGALTLEDLTDANGEVAIDIDFGGIGGSVGKNTSCTQYCYVKSLSGYAAGAIAFAAPYTKVCNGTTETCDYDVCGNPINCKETCDYEYEYVPALRTTLCDVCCGFDGWCNDTESTYIEVENGDFIPAIGTWSMKFNKNITSKNIFTKVPDYAL